MASATIPQVQKDKGFLPRQTKFLLGAFVIFAAIGAYVIFSTNATQQYFLTLSELDAKGALAAQQAVRVGGNLEPNSTHINSKDVTAQFALTDGSKVLPVVYKGVLPDMVEKSTQVIAEGKLGSDGVFHASLVMAKCPSKYDPSQIDWHSTADGGDLNYSAK
jgi:cytochrome c-type biogenesis protein CcmE